VAGFYQFPLPEGWGYGNGVKSGQAYTFDKMVFLFYFLSPIQRTEIKRDWKTVWHWAIGSHPGQSPDGPEGKKGEKARQSVKKNRE